jgi:hypothetical protein
MPKLELKFSKPNNFSLVSPNVTTARRKATIHIYCLKKFQKIQKFIAFIVACPNKQKPILVNNVL